MYTINIPGFILEEGSLTESAGALKLADDPVGLSHESPNLDLRARHLCCDRRLSDEVFISVMLSGTDASGKRQYAAKLLTLVGEDIYDMN